MSGKTAFVFSGQGAQYQGMGQELYENYPAYKTIFDRAADILGFSVADICFGGDSALDETQNTQTAIFTMSMAAYALLRGMDIVPDCAAGFSLGEYSALCAGEAYSFEALLPVVRNRGRYMAEAAPQGTGAMSAIMGLSPSEIEEVCQDVAAEGKGLVAPANYNMPGQIVIAGEADALAAAEKQLKAMGAKKTVPLKVSGPFHTALMAPAAEKLYDELLALPLSPLVIPVLTNVTGDFIEQWQEIPHILKNQVTSPVYWEQSIRRMLDFGVTRFVELGPGKTLCSFIKRICKNQDVEIYNVENLKSLEKVLQGF